MPRAEPVVTVQLHRASLNGIGKVESPPPPRRTRTVTRGQPSGARRSGDDAIGGHGAPERAQHRGCNLRAHARLVRG
eukprot:scaffold110992_cov66-Phaeocystis_antarctica.AAC.1